MIGKSYLNIEKGGKDSVCCDFTEEYTDQKDVLYRLGIALSFTLKRNTK